jgi:hypothetical protein
VRGGDETLKKRCDMLSSTKKREAQIQEMYRHLEKVSCKIAYFTKQYDAYKNVGSAIPPAAVTGNHICAVVLRFLARTKA